MKLIVAVDENYGIGKSNGLLFRLPADMKFFRETTAGKVVVMGLNTLNSFPGSSPLKNRVNIVLSDVDTDKDGITVVHSREELKKELEKYDTNDVFIIGGASVYRQFYNCCDTALITKVDADGGAEVFFPNLDGEDNWTLLSVSEPEETNGYTIRFCTYKNNGIEAL